MSEKNKTGCIFYLVLLLSLYISWITKLPIFAYLILIVIIFTIAFNFGLFDQFYNKKYIKEEDKKKIIQKQLKLEEEKKIKENWEKLSLEEKSQFEKDDRINKWNLLTFEEQLDNQKQKSKLWLNIPFNEKMKFHKENKHKKKLQEILKQKEQRRVQTELQEARRLQEEKIKAEIAEVARIELEIKLKAERIEKEKIEQIKKRELEQKERIKSKILETEKKKRLEAEAIQELIDAGLIDNNHYTGKNIRESIPSEVKIAVWKRDREQCVNCFEKTNLEFDHIIPVSKGGANSIKNIQLLCRNCNRVKYNKII